MTGRPPNWQLILDAASALTASTGTPSTPAAQLALTAEQKARASALPAGQPYLNPL